MTGDSLKVISASRRVEMPGFFPDRLAAVLEQKAPPRRVHSLVLWTKNPGPMLVHSRLRPLLETYEQLFIHVTVTGMGGTILESGIPATDAVMGLLPDLIELAGDPRRIRFRFDPIVHLTGSGGRKYCNLPVFAGLIPVLHSLKIVDVSISWISAYPKVLRRLERLGMAAQSLSAGDLQKETQWLLSLADRYGLRIHGCCMPHMDVSRCIDGHVLNALHPRGLKASTQAAGSQRERCGCTQSWDLGWYSTCPGRCVYCYAQPASPAVRPGLTPLFEERGGAE